MSSIVIADLKNLDDALWEHMPLDSDKLLDGSSACYIQWLVNPSTKSPASMSALVLRDIPHVERSFTAVNALEFILNGEGTVEFDELPWLHLKPNVLLTHPKGYGLTWRCTQPITALCVYAPSTPSWVPALAGYEIAPSLDRLPASPFSVDLNTLDEVDWEHVPLADGKLLEGLSERKIQWLIHPDSKPSGGISALIFRDIPHAERSMTSVDSIAYIIKGEGVLEFNDLPWVTLKQGMVCFFLKGHSFTWRITESIEALCIYASDAPSWIQSRQVANVLPHGN